MAGVYLSAFLQPLRPYLARGDVTDIWVNRPGEVWLEHAHGAITREDAPDLTATVLDRLARQIASASHQGFNREQPLLTASLPDGERVQIVGAPVVREGPVLAIRRHGLSDMAMDELEEAGLFAGLAGPGTGDDAELEACYARGDYRAFLAGAVAARKTILLSGGTSSGKTTLMNALIKAIPPDERLVVIEDAAELRLPHANVVSMVASRGDDGEARVGVEQLLQASLRMRPDRILLGELRGGEAFSFLRAVNTGHPGSITTIHADSPAGALDQIALLALMGGARLEWEAIRAYIAQVVDIVVQMRRVGGQRRIVDIQWRDGA